MRGYNKVIIAGNLTRDPEMRYTVDKRAWANLYIAVNYTYKGKNGEYQEGADFFPVTVWGVSAENCGKYLRKGSPILVEGRLRNRSYEAKDGSGKKYITEIMATEVLFLSGGSRGDNNSQGSQYSGAPYPSASSANNYSSAAQPQDMPPFDPYGSGDDSFGSSIDDKGFDGDFAPDFNASSNSSSSSGKSKAEIPF